MIPRRYSEVSLKKFLLALLFVFCGHYAHASICNVTAGMNQSQFTSIISSCGSGNTVLFPAGTYTWTSGYTIPCGVSIQGPTPTSNGGSLPFYSQTPNQTAKFTGNFGLQNYGPLSTSVGCSTPQSIQFIEWDGQRTGSGGNLNPGGNNCRSEGNNYPTPPDLPCGVGGGNFIQIKPGTNHFTMKFNYIHGNVCGYLCADHHSILIELQPFGSQSGCCTFPSGYPVTNDVNISWNILAAVGDCNPATNYNDNNQNTEGGGGTCDGVGIQGAFTNLVVSNNIFTTGDDELKFFEMFDAGNTAGFCAPCTFNDNWFELYDRIATEMQINWGGPSEPDLVYMQFNSFANHLSIWQQDYDISQADGCVYNFNTANQTNCEIHMDYNTSVADKGSSSGLDPGYEFWAGNGSTASGNFWSGNQAGISVQWDPNGNFTANNNTIFSPMNNGNACNSGCTLQNGQSNPAYQGCPGYNSGNPPPLFKPSCSGNTSQNSNGTITSVAPVLSVSGGVVTIKNTNVSTPNGSNPGRDSNTTFWCTTNGNTPSPGGSGSVPYWVGTAQAQGTASASAIPTASQTVANVTTVGSGTFKCVGMWGAPNQPFNYVTISNGGGGYVPSAVTSIAFSNGPTTATPQISPASGNFTADFSVAITDTTPSATIHYTTDGSTPTTSSTVYTTPIPVSGVTTVVNAIAASSGNANSAIQTTTYTYVPPPTAFYGPQLQTETNSGSNAYFTADLITVIQPLTVSGGYIYLGAGGTIGDKVDIVVVPSTGYNTEAATPSCHATFTETTGTINAFTFLSFSGCTLPGGNYWLGYQTNDPGLAIGSYDCGGSPSVPACVLGQAGASTPSTYGLWFVLQPYGTYTGLATTFSGQASVQQSVYLVGSTTSTTATPVILPNSQPYTAGFNATITDGTSGATIYYTTDGSTPTAASTVYGSPVPISGATTTLKAVATSPGAAISSVVTVLYTYQGGGPPVLTGCQVTGASTVVASQVIQGSGTCTYTIGAPTNCGVSPDSNGNVINTWTASTPAIFSVGPFGAAAGCTLSNQGPGCVLGKTVGTANLGGSVGSLQCAPLSISVTHTLTSLSIATTGGVTSLQSSTTNQLIPLCTYSDSTSDSCPGITITYTSSNNSFATVTTNGGLVTGISPGVVNLGASVASPAVSATPISLTITPPTSHIIFNQQGISGFKGNSSVQ